MMSKLIGIKFDSNERLYYVASDIESDISVGDDLIVSTESGVKYAKVTNISDNEEISKVAIGDVMRIATEEDKNNHLKNLSDQIKALDKCKKLAQKLGLTMKPIKTEFTFDRSQLLINFFSDERVDFRELAKQMASIFKTRIEFRQVGIRDKAKIVGGIGPCGRKLCCSSFLYDFDSISISMAKNQMIALNPTKINGECGRLLCCLNYEDELYKEYRQNLPNVGKKLTIDGKSAKVVQIDLYNQKYVVEFEDKTQKEIVVKDGTGK